MIEWAPKILQGLVAFALLWIWVFRFGRSSFFRAGQSKNMKDEFAVYKLPEWSVLAVGGCKVLLSLSLLAGLLLLFSCHVKVCSCRIRLLQLLYSLLGTGMWKTNPNSSTRAWPQNAATKITIQTSSLPTRPSSHGILNRTMMLKGGSKTAIILILQYIANSV